MYPRTATGVSSRLLYLCAAPACKAMSTPVLRSLLRHAKNGARLSTFTLPCCCCHQRHGIASAQAICPSKPGDVAMALIARFRLVRDRVLPHAWSVFHCVATPRIPVHHAQELPIGGKLPSYFLLKSLTQSFPLEWRDVLRYQRLRKLHAGPPCGELCCAPRPVRGRPDAITGSRPAPPTSSRCRPSCSQRSRRARRARARARRTSRAVRPSRAHAGGRAPTRSRTRRAPLQLLPGCPWL